MIPEPTIYLLLQPVRCMKHSQSEKKTYFLLFVDMFAVCFFLLCSLLALRRETIGDVLRPQDKPLMVCLQAELCKLLLILHLKELGHLLLEPDQLFRACPVSWHHISCLENTMCDMSQLCGSTSVVTIVLYSSHIHPGKCCANWGYCECKSGKCHQVIKIQ
jgi:hypothetical protein